MSDKSKKRIIALEGGDGVGKKTQTELLLKKMKAKGYPVRFLSFPRYETFYGNLIKKYLAGDFGKEEKIPIEEVSMLFTLDRYFAAPLINSWVKDGYSVLLNRYVGSNMAYQAAKLPEEEKVPFMKLIYNREVNEFKIPAPDLVILLTLSLDEAEKAMRKEKRKKDIYEKDLKYSLEVHKTYRLAAKEFEWREINCMADTGGRRLTEKEVADKVWDVVRSYL